MILIPDLWKSKQHCCHLHLMSPDAFSTAFSLLSQGNVTGLSCNKKVLFCFLNKSKSELQIYLYVQSLKLQFSSTGKV